MTNLTSTEEAYGVSFVVVTYNRPECLALTIGAIESYLNYPNTEIIVCDDYSTGKQCELLDSLQERGILVIRQKENSGLGTNTNAGLRAAKYSMICQLQDDFVFEREFGINLYDIGRSLFESNHDFLSLTSVNSRCETTDFHQIGDVRVSRFKNDNIGKKLLRFERPYSDQPHFKSRKFIETIGLYSESLSMVLTELEYKFRVSQQGSVFICGTNIDFFLTLAKTCLITLIINFFSKDGLFCGGFFGRYRFDGKF